MRFLTSTLLLAIASGIAVNALPASSSALRTRSDDLTVRVPVEAFDEDEEAEEAADIAYLERRDLELIAARQGQTADQLAAEEAAEEADDEDYLKKRDAVLTALKRRRALQPFEQEEENDDIEDLDKRDKFDLPADETAEELEDEEYLRQRDLDLAKREPQQPVDGDDDADDDSDAS